MCFLLLVNVCLSRTIISKHYSWWRCKSRPNSMQKPKYNIIQRLLNRQIKDRSRLAAVAVQVLGFSFRGPLGWRHFHLEGEGRTHPILQQLHWLPVRERVIFKNALLVFKALHGLLPPYLADDCQLLADTGHRQLRSSDVATCSVLRTHSSLGDRCFAVAGPRTWNSFPIKLRQPDLSLEQFRRLLKTYLFS